jgi:hypothetical protein
MLKRTAENLSKGSNLKLLPPPDVGRWRLYERMALQLRSFAGAGLSSRLDPFALADSLKIKVMYLKDLGELLSDTSRARLDNIDGWSGGATPDLGDGSRIVVLNHRHGLGRQASTLMEEICHILFGHEMSEIVPDKLGGRSYNINVEEEAYAVGAAALVPYYPLKDFFVSGFSVQGVADHFGVTGSLVIYRAKGLQLHGYLS